MTVARRRRFCRTGGLLLAGAALILGGCQTPPPRPLAAATRLPDAYLGSPPSAGGGDRAIPARWWELFHDAALGRLETRTLTANYDLDAAEARLRAALAAWRGRDAGRRPSVIGDVEYRRQHEAPILKNHAPLLDQYVVTGVDATWDADLFGRVRRLAAAAQADAAARAAARDQLALTLTAEVARTYFDLRGKQQAQVELRQAAKLAGAELKLVRRRMAAGVADGVDLAEARRVLDVAKARLDPLPAGIARDLLHLGLLTAQPARALYRELARPEPLPAEPAAPAVGAPVDLLRARPDIREAAAEVAASGNLAAAARADLLPRLTFSGDLSFYAFGWGVGPQLTWDVFDRSRVRARQARAGADAEAAYARYQETVLAAVNDVERALADLAAARHRQAALRSAWSEAETLAADARRRARLGVANRADIVAAERTQVLAAAALAAQEAAVREGWVSVVCALGAGGGSLPGPPAAAAKAPREEKVGSAGAP